MKKILLSLFILTTVFVLVSCDNDPGKNGVLVDFSESMQKKAQITVWMDDDGGEYMKELIEVYNEVNPNVIVKFAHMGTVDAREKLKLYGPAKKGADIFQFPHDHLAQAVKENLVMPLSDTLRDEIAERILPVAMDIATICYDDSKTDPFACTSSSNKELYAVPNSMESVVMFYNPNLVDAPESFEEIIAASAAWKTEKSQSILANGSHWADAYFMQFMFSAFGWRPFTDGTQPSSVGYEKQEMKDALAWFRTELQKAAKFNESTSHDGAAKTAQFIAGQSAYLITGPWTINELQTAKANDDTFDFEAVPMPTINGETPKTFAGAQMSAVYKYTENPAAAQDFLRFLTTDEAMEILYRHKNKLPALKSELLADIEGLNDDPILQAVSKQLEDAIPMPTIPQVTYFWGPAETMLKAIWGTSATIDNAVQEAEQGYRSGAGLGS